MSRVKTLVLVFSLSLVSLFAQARNQDTVILDVRTHQERQVAFIPGSIHVDFHAHDFESQIAKLDPNKNYRVYCRSGNRSQRTIEFMRQKGFKNLENLGSLEEARERLKH